MANTALKFIKIATVPSTGLVVGTIYFETSTNLIKVATSATATQVFSGVQNASYNDSTKVLTIKNQAGTTISLDFSDMASANSVAEELGKKVDKVITVTGGDGLAGGGSLEANRTITHAYPAGAGVKTSGLYKIATDKFGHVTGATEVTKTDITGLGIPGVDTNTTYTFANGTNGFTVTPSGGTAQTITVTPSITNNVVKTAAATTAGYIPKFNNTTGAIENGYSIQTTLSSNASAIPTAAAVVAAIDSKIAAADAMIFKGTLGTGGDITTVPTNSYKTGWTYKVVSAGTYAGNKCEIGDMLIALKDGPASGTTVVDADWTVVQANIDGAVTGPASATTDTVAIFDGATGKVIKSSNLTIKTSVPANAVFTDTKVTAVGNHYKPTGGTAATETAGSAVSAGGKVITAVTADAAGHITGVTTGTIPAAPTLSGLGGVGTVSATGTAPLTLAASKSGTTVSITGSVGEMKGATAAAAGASGVVPSPAAGKQTSFLRGDGTWVVPTNTNTTYTFNPGTTGNFTVTPSGGNAQVVSIGKPTTAGTADRVAQALSINVNGTSTSYNGEEAKTAIINASALGAVTTVNLASSTLEVASSKSGTTVSLTADLMWQDFA